MTGVNADPHSPEHRAEVPDLRRPRWTNLLIAGGIIMFWAGFLLWLFK
jgi:hypothetical protein